MVHGAAFFGSLPMLFIGLDHDISQSEEDHLPIVIRFKQFFKPESLIEFDRGVHVIGGYADVLIAGYII